MADLRKLVEKLRSPDYKRLARSGGLDLDEIADELEAALRDGGNYDASAEWAKLFQFETDGQPSPVERAMAFLRLWANTYLLNGSYWDVPQTMGSALNQAIRILEAALRDGGTEAEVEGSNGEEVETLLRWIQSLRHATTREETWLLANHDQPAQAEAIVRRILDELVEATDAAESWHRNYDSANKARRLAEDRLKGEAVHPPSAPSEETKP